MDARRNDWKNGAVVYQIFVDRFAPSAILDQKRGLYAAPQKLHPWTETPKPSAFDPKLETYPHVLDFWGGDLNSLRAKLDYVRKLGADVLYLNPIFRSPSNHKYDTEDYFQVDPQYGSNADLAALIKDVHRSDMKLMLDGVFNHIGETSPLFIEAKTNPTSPRRDWFFFDKTYEKGYRGWAGVASLPALKVENPEVRQFLWGGRDSVVRKWLRDGIDGWRLDVAFELGPKYLTEITKASHAARAGSAVVGEIAGYPADWPGGLDGVFNFTATTIARNLLDGQISGGRAGRMLEKMVEDAGIEFLLKSWILTDNHDMPRLATMVPKAADRHLIRLLQFTLPGSPCLYYGSELGMTGGGDPECRAPMRWDLETAKNEDLNSTKTLLAIRKALPSLRFGDLRVLETDKLLAFARVTDRIEETAIVVVNPTKDKVTETFATRVGQLMSWGELKDVLRGSRLRTITGMLSVEMAPRSAMILTPVMELHGGYSPYDRLKTPPP